MNRVNRFIKNIVSTVVTKVIPPLLSLLLIISIAHYLGVTELGKFTFITTLFVIFQLIGSFSFSFLLIREISKDKSKADVIYSSSIYLGILLSGVYIMFSGLTVTYLNYSFDVIKANWILCLALIPSFCTAINESVFISYERNDYVTFVTLVENIFKVCLSLFAINLGYGIVTLFVIFIMGHILASILGFIIIEKRFFKPSFRINLALCKNLIRNVPVFTFIFSLGMIFLSTDVLMLSKMKTNYEVGLYSVALKLANFLKILADSVLVVLYPILSKSFQNERETFNTLFSRSFHYLFLLLLPIALLVTLLSKTLIQLFFNSEYLNASRALQILAWTMVANAGHALLGYTLIASNNQNKVPKIMISGIAINILLNFILIPIYSYNGAAVGTLISSFYLVTVSFYIVTRYLNQIELVRVILKPFIAILATACFIWFSQITNVAIVLLGVPIIYFMMVVILKTFEKEDIILLKKIGKSIKIGNFSELRDKT